MVNIDVIMDMLDWNQPEDVQEKGRLLAREVRCINVFLQPGSKEHNKNVWGNCAQILSERSDEELQPYVGQMLNWLLDMNWPGAMCVFERLKNYKDIAWLNRAITESTNEAQALHEENWLLSLQELKNYIFMENG